MDELADAVFDTGDTGTALEYWQDALALYQELGAPEADELTARLTVA